MNVLKFEAARRDDFARDQRRVHGFPVDRLPPTRQMAQPPGAKTRTNDASVRSLRSGGAGLGYKGKTCNSCGDGMPERRTAAPARRNCGPAGGPPPGIRARRARGGRLRRECGRGSAHPVLRAGAGCRFRGVPGWRRCAPGFLRVTRRAGWGVEGAGDHHDAALCAPVTFRTARPGCRIGGSGRIDHVLARSIKDDFLSPIFITWTK